MSFNLEKEISIINKDIKDEENQLQKLNSTYKQIPENIIIYHSKKMQDSQNNLNSLINTFEILSKIDKINETENIIEKLSLLKSLLLSNKISNTFLKEFIITKLINNNILNSIQESLLNIKYPLFEGKMLMTMYEQLNTNNKKDLDILSLYFEIYSYIAKDIYKEFANYGTLNKLNLKYNEKNDKSFYFVEMISEYLFKKIMATIFYDKSKNKNIKHNAQNIPGYQKKLSNQEINVLFQYEKLISYLNKCIYNTSELFTILINKANEDNKNNEYQFERNITLKLIISSLLEKLILFLTSEETPLDLSNCTTLLTILLIQKTNEHTNELLKNYQYDSIKNFSLYDYIKYYLNDNPIELKKRQKEFNENIISKFKENIKKERNSKTYKTEDLLDYISMIIKDIISIYETFRTYTIIEELLICSCEDIFSIFQNYYNSETNIGFNQKGLSIDDNLFLVNLLYDFLNICSKEFNSFLERINLFNVSIINKVKEVFENFKNKVNTLYKDYMTYILSKIEFKKIIKLYDYDNLKKGNTIDNIQNIFNEEKDFWFKIKSILRTIKANKEIYKYIETEVFKFFVQCLTQKIINSIEKTDIEGKNLDSLIDSTKAFIEDVFVNDENEISEENIRDIEKLYSYLDNLYMNKK